MGVVQIEDSILGDERFKSFVGMCATLEFALGTWLRALYLLLDSKDHSPSISEWDAAALPRSLVDVGLFHTNTKGHIEINEPRHCVFKKSNKKAVKLRMTAGDLVSLWNMYSGKLPKVRELTPKRHVKTIKRLSECDDVNQWIEVIKIIAQSPFCTGENDRKWKANYEFLIKPDTRVQMLEGQYGKLKTNTGLSVW